MQLKDAAYNHSLGMVKMLVNVIFQLFKKYSSHKAVWPGVSSWQAGALRTLIRDAPEIDHKHLARQKTSTCAFIMHALLVHSHRFVLNNSPWIWKTHPFGPTKGCQAARREAVLFSWKGWAAPWSSRALTGTWWEMRAHVPALGCLAASSGQCTKALLLQTPGTREALQV